jgi:hypothetical protein
MVVLASGLGEPKQRWKQDLTIPYFRGLRQQKSPAKPGSFRGFGLS